MIDTRPNIRLPISGEPSGDEQGASPADHQQVGL